MFSGIREIFQIFSVKNFHAIARHISLCLRIRAERKHLSQLSDEALRDIGQHRGDTDNEAKRGFWDVPDSRRIKNIESSQPNQKLQSCGLCGRRYLLSET